MKLQPRASQNEIGEPLGGELKIKITAPPVEAAANESLVKFIAEKRQRERLFVLARVEHPPSGGARDERPDCEHGDDGIVLMLVHEPSARAVGGDDAEEREDE